MPPLFRYRLEIAPSLQSFQSEIFYAFNYINRYYGMSIDDGAPTTIRYGGPSATLSATFFEEYIFQNSDGVSLIKSQRKLLSKLWPSGTDFDTVGIKSFDFIGLIFFMLSRIEERNASQADKHDRFLSYASLSYKNRWLKMPVVDECAQRVAHLIFGKRVSPVSNHRVLLTHDVDKLRAYHYLLEPIRYMIGDLTKRGKGFSSARRLLAYTAGEPWSSVKNIMDLSEKYGMESNFFFMGPSSEKMDSPYAITMRPLLKKIIRHILARGHKVGFHPGYRTHLNDSEFRKQKNSLEELIGFDVLQGRQHVIRYDCSETPKIWSDSGMKKDFTLFFPDKIGFRNGSCRSYSSYDLKNRTVLSLEQTATSIADFSLLDARYNSYSVKEALALCEPIIQNVRKHNGDLVILFHTHQLKTKQSEFYDKLLARING